MPPTGMELTWTERLIGDYDQNGEVNYSDITPLSLRFNALVEYDDPALHGGFEEWPTGDPEDDGGETPPLPGSGAANWRLARIDGDANGELNFGDVTPLAVHWMERMDGYRVYRKAPGEIEFSVLEQDGGPAGYTVAHPAPAPTDEPVRYLLSDDKANPAQLGDGTYHYYVRAYDAGTDTEGLARAVLTVNLATQVVNRSPVARLNVDPGFAGAPAEITLDASASYDMDGSIAAYEWDFDADGTPDWLSTDPVPETSSGGAVTEVTPGAAGIVTVSYNQGSEEWYYPSVVAIDDQDARSQPANATLGISGWVQQLVSSDDDSATFDGDELSFRISNLAEDPNTHELVAAGFGKISAEYTPDVEDAVYFARRSEDGTWSEEIAVPYGDSVWHHDFRTYAGGVTIHWNPDGQPLLIIIKSVQVGFALEYWSMTAHRSAGGTWNTALLYGGDDGKHGGSWGACPTARGRFMMLVRNMQSEQFHLLNYAEGTISLEYTGFDAEEHELQQPTNLSLDGNNNPYMLISDNREGQPHLLVYWGRNGPEDWEPGYFDDGQFGTIGYEFETLRFRPDGTPLCLVVKYDDGLEGATVVLTSGKGADMEVRDIRSGTNGASAYSLLISGEALLVISNDGRVGVGSTSYCDRLEGNNIIGENIFSVEAGTGYARSSNGVVFEDGATYCATSATFTSGADVSNAYVSSRVDPRL
jgi:hypothetical protein